MNDTPITITKKEKRECDVRSIYVGANGEQCNQDHSDPAHRKLLLKEKFTPKPKVYALEVDDRLENTIDWNKIYPPKYFPKAFKAFIDEELWGECYNKKRRNLISIVDGEKGSNAWDNILKELICNPTTKTGELTQFCCYFAAWAGHICASGIGGRQFETFIICSELPISQKVWREIDRQMFAYIEGYENAISVEQIAAVSDYMLKESPKPNLDTVVIVEKLEKEIGITANNLKDTKSDFKIWNREIEMDIKSLREDLNEARLNLAKSLLPSSDSENKPIK